MKYCVNVISQIMDGYLVHRTMCIYIYTYAYIHIHIHKYKDLHIINIDINTYA